MDNNEIETLLKLTAMSFKLGETFRITKHPDGKTSESDTTHSIMLAIICCHLIDRWNLQMKLDIGLVTQFCIIHDAHETIGGDIQTLVISNALLKEKKETEEKAIRSLAREFPGTWIEGLILEYHKQVKPEARFVRLIDKQLPKLSHILNSCIVLREMGVSKDQFTERMDRQVIEMREYSNDLPEEIFELHRQLAEFVKGMLT